MIARLKAAARRRDDFLLEDALGVATLFAVLFLGLALPSGL
ncbi:hypothetical protein [Pseudogemmobacter sonorensis]